MPCLKVIKYCSSFFVKNVGQIEVNNEIKVSFLEMGPASFNVKENIKETTLRKARETLDVEFIHEGNREGLQGSAGTRWTLPVALIN